MSVRVKKIKVHCNWCGKEKWVYPSVYRQTLTKRFFCNKEHYGLWKTKRQLTMIIKSGIKYTYQIKLEMR